MTGRGAEGGNGGIVWNIGGAYLRGVGEEKAILFLSSLPFKQSRSGV